MLTGEGLDVVVHSTHEAGYKIGGIGAVLDGLLTARAYLKNVRRTVLVGTFDQRDTTGMERLKAPRNRFEVLYSSLDEVSGFEGSDGLRKIEEDLGVRILYGRRMFGSAAQEVLLVDPTYAKIEPINDLKGRLYQRFGIRSELYESNYEYDLYVRAGLSQFEALRVILGPDMKRRRNVMMAHEFMGVPLCLVAEVQQPGAFSLVYYAHEVPTVRPVVEDHPGHDTMFYNVLRLAQADGLTFGDVFGDRSGFYKHALLENASEFAAVFAVGDLVVDELRFLGSGFATKAIDLVYNGIPAPETSIDDKVTSTRRLKDYAEALLGTRPDHVFTHVARLVTSKGLWRDFRVLEELDPLLTEQGRTAVLFVLATAPPSGRNSADVMRMEAEYGWPVHHRVGYPDLDGAEVTFNEALEAFNQRSNSIKAVFINQFGWDQERCGMRMPADMTFADLRRGTDLEFGQSIYEPFGIAQYEALPFGGLCVVSNACGCVGFSNRVGAEAGGGIVIADYISLPPSLAVNTWQDALQIGQETRDLVERHNARDAAETILHQLPRDDAARAELMRWGSTISSRMTWEVVVSEYLLPALARALHAS